MTPPASPPRTSVAFSHPPFCLAMVPRPVDLSARRPFRPPQVIRRRGSNGAEAMSVCLPVCLCPGWGKDRRASGKPATLKPLVARLLGGGFGRPLNGLVQEDGNQGAYVIAADALYDWLLSDGVDLGV
jgi:hypothetical protein